MPKVSVIIPVYNVEKYLRQCLDSIINQTLRDIEIICVDDGSTDGSTAILAEYAAKDPRVEVLTREHTNAGAARNAGMAVATGEYLGFVDSDDWCAPTLFNKAYSKAKADDADIVSWRFEQYDERTKKTGSARVFPDAVMKAEKPFSADTLGDLVFAPFAFGPWCRLVRRAFVVREGILFQELARTNDVYFCCMARVLAPSQTIVDEVLYTYRAGTGANLQANNGVTPETVVLAWERVAQELSHRGVLAKFRRPLFSASANSFFYTLNSMADASSFVAFFELLKKTYGGHPLFSEAGTQDISSGQTAKYLTLLKENNTALDFLVALENYHRVRLADEYWGRRGALKELDAANRDLRSSREEVKRLAEALKEAGRRGGAWNKVCAKWMYRLVRQAKLGRTNRMKGICTAKKTTCR